MKQKLFACMMAVILVFSAMGTAVFAQTDLPPDAQEGALMITEPGSYVLQGKLTGCVCVDPGKGDVELILDGADIDGGKGPGIVALSGDHLTVTLPEGSVNRVVDGGPDDAFPAAIFSRVDTQFQGNGALYVTGNRADGVILDLNVLLPHQLRDGTKRRSAAPHTDSCCWR